ncbi:MAG: hypothetical protein CMH30_01020 [Micavibrio sp.]|nr:hypothetical protein [Micavibrio sp.]|tara:strand:- start:983 stop:1642 length:660 start_codon:yes stop_codon:yes gene_type:complete
MAKLFFVGDSIGVGAWDECGGWVARLSGKIMQQNMQRENLYCLPYNISVSGDTFEDALNRFDNEVYCRLDDDDAGKIQFLFSLGSNDAIFRQNENRQRFTDEAFKNNIFKLIERAKQYSTNISFTGLLPVNEELVSPMPWSPEESYKNSAIKNYEDIIKGICSTQELNFLPMYQTWLNMPQYKELFSDGVHPNSKGHALMAEQIGAFLLTDAFYRFHGA